MGILMSSIGLIDVLCLKYFLLYEVYILNYLLSFSYEEYVYVSVIYNQYVLQKFNYCLFSNVFCPNFDIKSWYF